MNKKDNQNRLPSVEMLESRVLLSTSPLLTDYDNNDLFSNDLPMVSGIDINAISPLRVQSSTYNKNDTYISGGAERQLLRLAGEIVIGISNSQNAGDWISTRVSDGNVLEKFQINAEKSTENYTRISSNRFGLALAEVKTEEALAKLALENGVDWYSPIFVNPSSGAEIVITKDIYIALKPGVNPERYFNNIDIISYRPVRGADNEFVITVPEKSGEAVIQRANRLNSDLNVAWAMPDYLTEIIPDSAPNDTLYGLQWHLDNSGFGGGADANLESAWNIERGSDKIVVAVLDDGVELTHPDLNIWTNPGEIPNNGKDDDGNGYVDDIHGWDFNANKAINSSYSGIVYSSDNHGTAVAGVAAAVGDNNLGVSGVAQNVSVMSVKVIGGDMTPSRMAEAIRYAAGINSSGNYSWGGADILNCSWHWDNLDNALDPAIADATANGRGGLGATIFAASGNDASIYKSDGIGIGTGNWSFRWVFDKNSSISDGQDTAWLANIHLPDGSDVLFDSQVMPTGWNNVGDVDWYVENDLSHAYGTGRYQLRVGNISHNQQAIIETPMINVTDPDEYISFSISMSSEEDYDTVTFQYDYGNGWTTYVPFTYSGVWERDGNDDDTDFVARDYINYPASNSNVIAVGASTDWDYRSHYSQYGTGLDFVAPSGGGFNNIVTTDRTGEDGYSDLSGSAGDYAYFSGTSSATPLAAGIAALLLSHDPTLTASEIEAIMKNTADEIGGVTYTSGVNEYYGHGRVNAEEALLHNTVTEDTSNPSLSSFGLAAISRSDAGNATSTDYDGNHALHPIHVELDFNERVFVDDYNDIIIKKNGVTITPVMKYLGLGTDAWTLQFEEPLAPDTYSISLYDATDQAGNSLSMTSQEFTINIESLVATLEGIEDRNSSIASYTINFNKSVDPTTFSKSNLTLKRGTTTLDISGASYTLTSSNQDKTWVFGNLTGLTGLADTYELILSGTGIKDTYSRDIVTTQVSDTWDVAVFEVDIQSVSSPRNTSVTQINIVFSEAVDDSPAVVDLSDFVLTRGGNNVAWPGSGVSISSPDSTNYSISGTGLESITESEGVYVLTLAATGNGIVDSDSNGLDSGDSITWTVDKTAPEATLPNLGTIDQSFDSLTISFDEEVIGFELEDITLKRAGSNDNLLDQGNYPDVSLNPHGTYANTWILSGLHSSTEISGTYTLEVIMDSLQDVAGNSFAGDDATWSAIIPTAPIDGDINGDGSVGLLDLDILGQNWGMQSGATWAMGDLSGDGAVGLLDLDLLGQNWGSVAMRLTPSADPPVMSSNYDVTSTSIPTIDLFGYNTFKLNFNSNDADVKVQSAVIRIYTTGSDTIYQLNPYSLNTVFQDNNDMLEFLGYESTQDSQLLWDTDDVGLVYSSYESSTELIATFQGANFYERDIAQVVLEDGVTAYYDGEFVIDNDGVTEYVSYSGTLAAGPTVTINSLSTTDTTPGLSGTVADDDATVTVTVDGTEYAATNNQDGTWTLADNTIATLAEGTYDVTVAAENTSGHIGIDSTADELKIDLTNPTVSIVEVSPDPITTPIHNLVIVFDEPVSGLDTSDLALERDGNAASLSNMSVETFDFQRWFLVGLYPYALEDLTDTDGDYELTLTASGSGITDLAGNSLTTDATEQWTLDTTAPTVAITAVTPDPRSTAVSSIAITFSEQVTNFDFGNLILEWTDGVDEDSTLLDSQVQTLTTSDGGTTWTLGNLSGITGTVGHYYLTLYGSDIEDMAGNAISYSNGVFEQEIWQVV